MTEYYERMPPVDELPLTLPAGTWWWVPEHHCGDQFLSEATRQPAMGDDNFKYVGEGAPLGVNMTYISWKTVPRTPPAPAKLEPKEGAWCEGTIDGDDEVRVGAFVAYSDLYFTHMPGGAYAILRKDLGRGALNSLVTRESLRPVATPSADYVHRCAKCREPVASEGAACVPCGEASAVAAMKPDPYTAHRKNAYVGELGTGFTFRATKPEQCSRLDQGIAAARRQSAIDAMNAPMVKRGKRVQWIQLGHPSSWPSNEGDDEP